MKIVKACEHYQLEGDELVPDPAHDGKFSIITLLCKECFTVEAREILTADNIMVATPDGKYTPIKEYTNGH